MATDKTSYVKGGIKIPCSNSLLPAPRPQASWPIPAFQSIQTSLLVLSLVAISGQAIAGILVSSAGPLPSPSASWTLYDQCWQGSTPSPLPQPTAIPLTLVAGMLSYTITAPMAGATHLLWLVCVDGTTTTTYPATTITTPVDPTQPTSIIALNTGANLIPNGDSELGPLPNAQTNSATGSNAGTLVYDTTNQGWGGSRYVRRLQYSGSNSLFTDQYRPVVCAPGDVFRLDLCFKCVTPMGTFNDFFFTIKWYSSTGAYLGSGLDTSLLWGQVFTAATWYQTGVGTVPIQTFTAPAGAAGFSVVVMGNTAGIEYWLDNLNLYKVPAPATASALGSVKVGAALTVAADGTVAAQNATGYATPAAGVMVAAVKVLGTQQSGLGTALAAYTYSGTYATDYSHLQLLHNKVVAMETILRAHGLAIT